MEQKIMEVLRRMQPVLEEGLLRELKNVLHMVFAGCDVAQKAEIQCLDNSWRIDMEDYLMSKALEGKSVDTVKRYRYELSRLLSYINKPVADITDGDISGYMRAYKSIREVQNSTLKGVRAVYSSFFVWLRDRDRIRKNPMMLVESIKVAKRVKRPFTDTEREQLLRSCATIRDKATNGSNTITVVAKDKAGKTTTVTRKVTLDTGAPVFEKVTLTPNPVDCGKTFIISVKVTD